MPLVFAFLFHSQTSDSQKPVEQFQQLTVILIDSSILVISNHWLFLVTICILPLLIPPCNGDLEPLGVLDIWLFMNFSVVISVDDRTHEKQLKLPKHVKPKTIYYIYQEYASGWNKFCTYMKNLHDLRFFFLNVTNHTYISVHLQS